MISPLRLLLGARGLRDFGDGFVAVLLPVYLMALGFSPLEVGALAGTALFGSALLTLAIGFLGVRYDHRLLLISSAGLMTATGVALSIVDSYALLLVVALAVVTEAERTAAASFTSVPRSLAASLSPAIAGALFSLSWQASPLIVCGALKIVYDLLLLNQFRYLKPPEER